MKRISAAIATVDPEKVLQVRIEDASILEQLGRIAFIKIDVEGFEIEVLKALENTLVQHHPYVICEVIADWLVYNGETPQAVIDRMSAQGYSAFRIDRADSSLFQQKAKLTKLDHIDDDFACNVLFAHETRLDELSAISFKALPK